MKANSYSNTQTSQGQKEKGHTPFGAWVGHLFLQTGLKSPLHYKPLDRHWRLSLTTNLTPSFSWDSPRQDLSCSCPGHSLGRTRPAHGPETFSEFASARSRASQAAHTQSHQQPLLQGPSTRRGGGNSSPHEHGWLSHRGQSNCKG